MSTDNNLEGRLVRLTRDLVLIESTDSQPEERRRCFQLIHNHLEGLEGLDLTDHRCGDYDSLLALPHGIEKPEVLLCAHLDVVEHPKPESYRSELRDGRIYGPGAGDMKGALAIMLELFRKWHQQRPGVSLGLVVTSDEERGGHCGLRYLVDACGLRCDVAIIPDGGSLTEITAEEKGILHVELRASGRSAHAARPWLGVNAVEALVTSLTRIREDFAHFEGDQIEAHSTSGGASDDHWHLTCEPTIFTTDNDSFNRLPDTACATLDIRYPGSYRAEAILDRLHNAVGAGVSVDVKVAAEPTRLSPDPAFVDIVAEVTGKSPQLVRICGGSDGRFLSRHDIPVILSRPEVGNLHNPDEWIDIASMQTYHEICDRYLAQRFG